MRNLVIGNTSQLARYFPDDYVKISSRNIDVNYLQNNNWNNVYICYAEQRTFLANTQDPDIANLFDEINYKSVLKLISNLKHVKRIVYYSTAELWNNKTGPICVKTPFSYISNHYTNSKYNISYELKDKQKYSNVCVAYPFNFNSIYRSEGYLFSKIFQSIIKKEEIEIGDIDYYRELLHPSMVVKESIKNENICDFIIGSGRVVYVKDFIEKLYQNFDMDFKKYVKINNSSHSIYATKIFYNKDYYNEYTEPYLLHKTIEELNLYAKGSYEF